MRTIYECAAEVFQFAARRGSTPAEAMALAARVLRANKALGPVRRRIVAPMAFETIKTIAASHGLTVDDLLAPDRMPAKIAILHEAMWILLRRCGVSSVDIGALLRRDHATVLHGAKRFAARLATDEILRARVERFVAGLRAEPVAA